MVDAGLSSIMEVDLLHLRRREEMLRRLPPTMSVLRRSMEQPAWTDRTPQHVDKFGACA